MLHTNPATPPHVSEHKKTLNLFVGPGLSLVWYIFALHHSIPGPVRLRRRTKNSTNRKSEDVVFVYVLCKVFISYFKCAHNFGGVGNKYEAKIERLQGTRKFFLMFFEIILQTTEIQILANRKKCWIVLVFSLENLVKQDEEQNYPSNDGYLFERS